VFHPSLREHIQRKATRRYFGACHLFHRAIGLCHRRPIALSVTRIPSARKYFIAITSASFAISSAATHTPLDSSSSPCVRLAKCSLTKSARDPSIQSYRNVAQANTGTVLDRILDARRASVDHRKKVLPEVALKYGAKAATPCVLLGPRFLAMASILLRN